MGSATETLQDGMARLAAEKGRPLRVFYLLNHQTAMPFEVELLVRLGFEVFVPKILPENSVEFRSGRISHEWDSTLSLAPEDLERLNRQDFYSRVDGFGEIMDLINREFDLAILIAYPPILDIFVRDFWGVVSVRAYGQANAFSYADYFRSALGEVFVKRVEAMGQRFLFSNLFPQLAEEEASWLARNAFCLNLGVSDDYYLSQRGSWRGGGGYVLFHAPDIASVPYYQEKYQAFRSIFGEFPYRVIGGQAVPVDDPGVLGYISAEAFNDTMRNASLFVYASDERKHLHYTPVEAMITGIPVLFDRRGVLFGMFSALPPGAYASPEEAKALARRLLEGDDALRAAILESQQEIVARHTSEACFEQWSERFRETLIPALDAAHIPWAQRLAEWAPYWDVWQRAIRSKGRPLRVFYLLNHQTAMPFEVALFRRLGLEVYVPKIVPGDNVEFRSASITDEWDASLTIPAADLKRLNDFNFYQDAIPGSLAELICESFDMVFLIAHAEILGRFVSFYNGVLALRIYGQDNTFLYSRYFQSLLGDSLPARMGQLGKKLVFAQIFPQIADGEAEWLVGNPTWLSLGVPENYYASKSQTWKGGGDYLVFHAPEIESINYYKRRYTAFRDDFGDFNYRVIGGQAKAVDDPNVLGYVSRDVVDDVMQRAGLFLYTSPEYKHLHYTPVEAMIAGVPVVFNREGALYHMFPEAPPGAYETTAEARQLVSRILSGDRDLIQAILESQRCVVERHTFDWCLSQWRDRFEQELMPLLAMPETPAFPAVRMQMKLAVILPERYRGGTLRAALNIVRMLVLGARAQGDDLEVSFGHLDDPALYSDDDFRSIRELGVRVRPFKLERLGGEKLRSLYQTWMPLNPGRQDAEYLVFNDGISNFEDADFWLMVSDRLPCRLPPHRDYAVVAYDYIQRYVPSIFGTSKESQGNWKLFEQFADVTRLARFVMCTTTQTTLDCINYVGAIPSRVMQFPMEFDPLASDETEPLPVPEGEAPYILWTSNSTEHKNHLNILDGLERYFRKHPESPLQIRLSGVYTQLFDASDETARKDPLYQLDYSRQVRERIQACAHLRKRLKIVGYLDDSQYQAQLAGAHWLLHGALYDNGTYALIEAAWFGVPSISSDYPAIREVCGYFGLDVLLFDGFRPETLCAVLESADAQRESQCQRLPSRSQLASRSYAHMAPRFWYTFKQTYLRTSLRS